MRRRCELSLNVHTLHQATRELLLMKTNLSLSDFHQNEVFRHLNFSQGQHYPSDLAIFKPLLNVFVLFPFQFGLWLILGWANIAHRDPASLLLQNFRRN